MIKCSVCQTTWTDKRETGRCTRTWPWAYMHVHNNKCLWRYFTSQVRWVGGCMCYESKGLSSFTHPPTHPPTRGPVKSPFGQLAYKVAITWHESTRSLFLKRIKLLSFKTDFLRSVMVSFKASLTCIKDSFIAIRLISSVLFSCRCHQAMFCNFLDIVGEEWVEPSGMSYFQSSVNEFIRLIVYSNLYHPLHFIGWNCLFDDCHSRLTPGFEC